MAGLIDDQPEADLHLFAFIRMQDAEDLYDPINVRHLLFLEISPRVESKRPTVILGICGSGLNEWLLLTTFLCYGSIHSSSNVSPLSCVSAA